MIQTQKLTPVTVISDMVSRGAFLMPTADRGVLMCFGHDNRGLAGACAIRPYMSIGEVNTLKDWYFKEMEREENPELALCSMRGIPFDQIEDSSMKAILKEACERLEERFQTK